MAIHTIHNENFEELVLKAEKPVLIDFWASWCGPCRMFAPTLDAVAEEYGDEVIVGKVNVDEEPELAQKYRVASIPTLLLIKNGEEADRSIGAIPKDAVVAMFK